MKQTVKDMSIWTLNQIDKTYKLTSEFLKDVIYVSDAKLNTCVPLDINNPNHARHFKIIDELNEQAKKYNYENSVFHIVVGDYEFPNESVWMDNYLMVTSEDDFYQDNLLQYGCVIAHVVNEAWDVSESGSIRVINKNGVIFRIA